VRAAPATFGEEATALRRATHKTIKEITRDIGLFHFNKAVARIRELTNLMEKHAASDAQDIVFAELEAAGALVRLIEPFMPHFACEVWQQFGHKEALASVPWPKADPALCADDEVTIVAQVNGKLRATFQAAADAGKEELEKLALAQKNVQDFIAGKEIRKIIVVPGKIVNVVAA